jgi:hypothetical protein
MKRREFKAEDHRDRWARLKEDVNSHLTKIEEREKKKELRFQKKKNKTLQKAFDF